MWLVVVGASALLGLLIALWPVLSLAAFVLVALSVVVLADREIALGAVLLSSLLTLGAISWLGVPDQASLLTKLLIGLFVLGVVIDLKPGTRPEVPIAFIALAAMLVVSAAFGGSSRLLAAQALGSYLAAPIAYLATVNSNLGIKSIRRLSLLVCGIIAIQVPIMFVQSRFVGNVDDIGGTFGLGGSTQMLAIVFGIVWTIAGALLVGKRSWWLAPIGLAIASALMVSQAKAGFLFAAAGTVVVGFAKAVASPRWGIWRFLTYAALGLGAVAVLFYAYVFLGPILPGGAAAAYFWVHWLKNPSAVMGYLISTDAGGEAGRLGGTRLALTQARSLADLLIGHGPGLLSGSALGGASAAATSTIGFVLSWATSLTRFLLEVGLIGILLYLAAIATAVAAVVNAWRSEGDELGISVAAAAVGAAAVFVAGSIYHAPWTTDAIAVPFWCLLGMAVKWGRLRSAERDAAAPKSDSASAT
jgi:hypothetical protein